jgi:hypothetical protein
LEQPGSFGKQEVDLSPASGRRKVDGWMDGWRDERFEVQQGGCGFWILDKQNKTKILTQLAFVTWFLFQSLLAIFLREFSFKRACQLRQVMPKSGKKPIFRRESRLA